MFRVTCFVGDNIELHSNSNILKMARIKMCIKRTFCKESLVSFLIIPRFDRLCTSSSLVVEICGTIGMSKNRVFNISIFMLWRGWNKITHKNTQTHTHTQSHFKAPNLVFTENLSLSLPATCCAGHDIELPSTSNTSKTVRKSMAFVKVFKRVSNELANDI